MGLPADRRAGSPLDNGNSLALDQVEPGPRNLHVLPQAGVGTDKPVAWEETPMREVTNLMDHYRIVAQTIWNVGFWPKPELQNWDSWDRFEEIKRLLFNSLVVAQLQEGDECCKDLSTVNQIYQVVPSDPGPVPIMIHRPREGDRNRYWDDPVNEIKASDAELHFLDYFDWNDMGYVDFRYYRVRIAAFPSQPHLVGREALVERHHAGVFAVPTSGRQADR